MNKLEQSARQALEALESYSKSDYIKKQHPKRRANGEKAITALREALANPEERGTSRYEGWVEVAEQAEQEPVFYHAVDKFGCNKFYYLDEDRPTDAIPLYATPVLTKDLTDDELMQTYTNFNLNELGEQSFMIGFARAVIAADREKNK